MNEGCQVKGWLSLTQQRGYMCPPGVWASCSQEVKRAGGSDRRLRSGLAAEVWALQTGSLGGYSQVLKFCDR